MQYSPSSTREPCDEGSYMHHRHELELYLFVEPMKVDMHKLSQTAIELSRITNKTSNRIQETLTCHW